MSRKKIKPFYVICEDFNKRTFERYDVMEYLVSEYNETKPKDRPKTFDEFREFVKRKSSYMYWSRVQYELILVPMVGDMEKRAMKIDIYWQIIMNLDLITELFIGNVTNGK